MKNGIAFAEVLGFSVDSIDQSMFTNFVREDEIAQLGDQLSERFSIANGTDIMEEFSKQMFPDVNILMGQARNS